MANIDHVSASLLPFTKEGNKMVNGSRLEPETWYWKVSGWPLCQHKVVSIAESGLSLPPHHIYYWFRFAIMETGFEPSIIEMRGQFADHQTEPTAAQFSNLSVCEDGRIEWWGEAKPKSTFANFASGQSTKNRAKKVTEIPKCWIIYRAISMVLLIETLTVVMIIKKHAQVEWEWEWQLGVL